MQRFLKIILLLLPFTGLAQTPTLEGASTKVPGIRNDSLSINLLASRGKQTTPLIVKVMQTMDAAKAFALQPLPFKPNSVKQVACYLAAPFKDEKLKAWAIYVWIGNNIAYDKDNYNPQKSYLVRTNPLEVLLYRKTTCLGYSYLYTEMMSDINIKTVTVVGYYKGTVKGSTPSSNNHAWNLVKVDGKWENLDASCYDSVYPDFEFMIDPNLFQKTHYTTSPYLQLASKPISYEEFKKPVLN